VHYYKFRFELTINVRIDEWRVCDKSGATVRMAAVATYHVDIENFIAEKSLKTAKSRCVFVTIFLLAAARQQAAGNNK
jgi:hypothetical protein